MTDGQKFKIVCIAQVYNELRKGNLKRFITHILPLVDELVVYDDGSTDGSYEYLKRCRCHVVRASSNDFQGEIGHKKRLLAEALKFNPDFVLWLDADEVLCRGAREKLQKACALCIARDAHGLELLEINLWRSSSWRRLDSEYGTGWFVRLWRVTPQLSYDSQARGLHQKQYPSSITKVIGITDMPVIHYGFASERSLALKYLTYRAHGQTGWALERLLSEKDLELEKLPEALFPDGLWNDDEKPVARSMEEALAVTDRYQAEAFKPTTTIICPLTPNIGNIERLNDAIQSRIGAESSEILVGLMGADTATIEQLEKYQISYFVAERAGNESLLVDVINAAALKARGDHLVILPPDTEFSCDTVRHLSRELEPDRFTYCSLPEELRKNGGEREYFNSSPLLIRTGDFTRAGSMPRTANARESERIFIERLAAMGVHGIRCDKLLVRDLRSNTETIVVSPARPCVILVEHDHADSRYRSVPQRLPFDDGPVPPQISTATLTPSHHDGFRLTVSLTTMNDRFDVLFPGESPLSLIKTPPLRDGQEITLTPGGLFKLWTNGYDFAAARAAIEREKAPPSVAFTIRNGSAKGGGSSQLYRYANWLSDLGVEVAIYSEDDPPDWIDLHCEYFTIPDDRERYAAIKETYVIVYSILDMPQVLAVLGSTHKAIFHFCQGLEEFHWGAEPRSITARKPIFQMLHALPVGRIVVSPHLEHYFESEHGQKSYYIPNGIDLTVFSPSDTSRDSNAFRVLCVGDPASPMKGIFTVIQALIKAIPYMGKKIHFDIACGFAAADVFEQFRDRLPFTYTIHQELSITEMRDLYRAADVYINSSIYEGFGLPSLEAMACGTPVIQSKNCGLDKITTEENCVVIDSGLDEHITKVVVMLHRDNELRQKLARGGLATAQKFSLVHQYQAFTSQFQTLLGVKFDPSVIEKQISALGKDGCSENKPSAVVVSEPVLFSVLMPTYNHAKYLAGAIESLQAQSYQRWEAVVVNDGSTDDTPRLLEKLSREDSRIKVIHKRNGGCGSALNAALANATGQWICWLSTDDFFEPDALESFARTLTRKKGHFYHGHYGQLREETGERVTIPSRAASLPHNQAQPIGFFTDNYVNGITVCIERSVFAQVGEFREELYNAQDFEMWLRISLRHRLHYVNRKIAVSRWHQNMGTLQFPEAGIFDSARACIETLNRVSLPELFPFLDFSSTSAPGFALHYIAEILGNPKAIIHQGIGYNPIVLEKFTDWLLNTAPSSVRTHWQAELAGSKARFEQILPAPFHPLVEALVNGKPGKFHYHRHDPLALMRQRHKQLVTSGFHTHAEVLQRYFDHIQRLEKRFSAPEPRALPEAVGLSL